MTWTSGSILFIYEILALQQFSNKSSVSRAMPLLWFWIYKKEFASVLSYNYELQNFSFKTFLSFMAMFCGYVIVLWVPAWKISITLPDRYRLVMHTMADGVTKQVSTKQLQSMLFVLIRLGMKYFPSSKLNMQSQMFSTDYHHTTFWKNNK